VLKVSGYDSTLLAGDIESEQELRLLEALPEKLSASVLVAPHHGSSTSSTLPFLRAVKPEFSLFTVGKNNRWGFPKPEVLANYREINSQILRTDEQGAITVFSSAAGLRFEAHRRPGSKLWY
jgi:competence protein ComEC